MPSMLVVDDDESICETVKLIFERNTSFHVDSASTGAEAVRMSYEKFYNVALIDIVLPDTDGVRLLTRLRETVPRMIKILITGRPTLDNAVEALNMGADAYIIKPGTPQELLNTVRRKLEEQAESMKMTQDKIANFVEERLRDLTSGS